MKIINTSVKTGDIVEYNGHKCKIGVMKNNKIQFTTILSITSGITEWITTRELNKRINSTKYA